MTAKRFTLGVCESGLGLTDNETKEQYLEVDDTTLIRLCEVLNGLSEENEQLKAQLLYDGDSVCNICKHQYLVETGKYYVAKCEKEHEECSKVDLQYCEDFELVRDYE